MTLLDELREIIAKQKELYVKKRGVLDAIQAEGGTWQEVAFIDQIAAIQMLHVAEPKTSLANAMEIVEKYIAERQGG